MPTTLLTAHTLPAQRKSAHTHTHTHTHTSTRRRKTHKIHLSSRAVDRLPVEKFQIVASRQLTRGVPRFAVDCTDIVPPRALALLSSVQCAHVYAGAVSESIVLGGFARKVQQSNCHECASNSNSCVTEIASGY